MRLAVYFVVLLLSSLPATAQDFAPSIDLGSVGNSVAGAKIDGAANGDLLGQAVTSLDFNRDGIADLAIASQGFDLTDSQGNILGGNTGAVYVLYGSPGLSLNGFDLDLLLPANGGDGSRGFVLRGRQSGEQVGNALANAGDVNGDGIDDLLIGSTNMVGNFNNGGAYIIFGRTMNDAMPAQFDLANLLTADGENSGFGVVFQGSQANGGAGKDVAGVGDISGDGLDDFVIGNAFAGFTQPRPAFSFVVYGRSSTAQWPAFIDMVQLQINAATGTDGFVVSSDAAGNVLGEVVAALGDFDGDGLNDFFLGSPQAAFANGVQESAGFIIPGRPSGPGMGFDIGLELGLGAARATVTRLLSDELDDATGFAAASVGDVNGDGRPDLAITANLADHGGTDSGTVYVLFGRSAPLGQQFALGSLLQSNGGNGSAGFIVTGAAGQQLGDKVAALGDVNGDGLDDFVVGARFDNTGGVEAGAAYVVFGRPAFPAQIAAASLAAGNGSEGFVLVGESAADQIGVALGATPDLDANGGPEIILGGRLIDAAGSNAGRVYLVDGVAASRAPFTGTATRAWFDPNRAGEGVLTEVGVIDGQAVLFVTWYTYRDGEQFWLAGGPQTFSPGASEVTMDLLATSGTGFGDQFDSADVNSSVWGSVTVSLDACDQLGWRYASADNSATGALSFVPLLANQLGLAGCSPAKGAALDSSYAGTWWNPQRAGEGIVVDLEFRGDTPTAFFSWFTYFGGDQRWLVGSAPLTAASGAIEFSLVETSGASFGGAFMPGDVQTLPWGTATMQFNGCDSASINFNGSFAAGPPAIGVIELQRFTDGLFQVPCAP